MSNNNFSVKGGQGFQITFENGYTVSVQFGKYHYCSNKKLKIHDDTYADDCRNAETAIFYKNDRPFYKYKGNDVQSYQSPKEVLETLKYAESLPNPEEEAYDIWEGAEDTDELDKKVSGIKDTDIKAGFYKGYDVVDLMGKSKEVLYTDEGTPIYFPTKKENKSER